MMAQIPIVCSKWTSILFPSLRFAPGFESRGCVNSQTDEGRLNSITPYTDWSFGVVELTTGGNYEWQEPRNLGEGTMIRTEAVRMN
jgi:hypothetical protein